MVTLLNLTAIKQYLLPRLRARLYPILSLLFVIGFGVWFAVTIPPFQAPDERSHFARVYGITEGQYIVQKSPAGRFGYELPASIREFFGAYDSGDQHVSVLHRHFQSVHFSDLKTQPKQEFDFENIAIYSPVNYAPQGLGLSLAKTWNLSLYDGFNFARLCALMFFVLAVMISYVLLPRRAWPVLFVVSALPSVVQQAASFSADSFTNSIMLLFMAVMVHYGVRKRSAKDDWLAILWVAAVSLLLAFCKPIYVLFSLLIFVFIGRQTIKNSTLRYSVLVLVFGISIGLAAWWNHQVADIGLNYASILGYHGLRPDAQLAAVLQMPLNYIGVLINTYVYDPVTGVAWAGGLIGILNPPTRPPVLLPNLFQMLAYGVMALAVLRTNTSYDDVSKQQAYKPIRTWQIGSTAMAGLLVFLAITTVLYVTFTPFAENYVTGLQARYFIPILILLLVFSVWHKIPKISISSRLQQTLIVSVVLVNLSILAYSAGLYFNT